MTDDDMGHTLLKVLIVFLTMALVLAIFGG